MYMIKCKQYKSCGGQWDSSLGLMRKQGHLSFIPRTQVKTERREPLHKLSSSFHVHIISSTVPIYTCHAYTHNKLVYIYFCPWVLVSLILPPSVIIYCSILFVNTQVFLHMNWNVSEAWGGSSVVKVLGVQGRKWECGFPVPTEKLGMGSVCL